MSLSQKIKASVKNAVKFIIDFENTAAELHDEESLVNLEEKLDVKTLYQHLIAKSE